MYHFATIKQGTMLRVSYIRIILFNLCSSLYNIYYYPHLTDEATDVEMQKPQIV